MDIVTLALAKNYSNTLYNRITNMGRFLSLWNATTGMPVTFPTSTPYEYKTGDYYIVNTVGTTNYKPSGSSYMGTASTTAETSSVHVLDLYYYDGTTWTLVAQDASAVTINVTYTDGTTGVLTVKGTLV